MRGLLLAALRAADAAWTALSQKEKASLLQRMKHAGDPSSRSVHATHSTNATNASPAVPPWAEVGRVLLNEVWGALHAGLDSLTVERVKKNLMYRWRNDMGGGDYSTGLTTYPGEDTRPTWIEERKIGWRDFDERAFRVD